VGAQQQQQQQQRRDATARAGTTENKGGEAARREGGKEGKGRGAMALGVRAAPFTYVAHALAVVAAAMVLVWAIHFRGGLAIEAANKNLIFNVHPVLMLIGFIIIGSEAIMVYKSALLDWDRNDYFIWYSVDIWIRYILLPWCCTKLEEEPPSLAHTIWALRLHLSAC
ncbi:unnamed protein product, partial [Urochloa humidicola]